MYCPGEVENAMRDATAQEATPPSPPLNRAEQPSALSNAGALGVSTLALAVAACGGGGSSSTGGGPPPVSTVRKPQTDGEAARFLLQASLSASTGAITQLRSEGYEPWLDRQIAAANSQSAKGFFADRGFDRVDANRFYNGAITGD